VVQVANILAGNRQLRDQADEDDALVSMTVPHGPRGKAHAIYMTQRATAMRLAMLDRETVAVYLDLQRRQNNRGTLK
jgi:hypothetical protein